MDDRIWAGSGRPATDRLGTEGAVTLRRREIAVAGGHAGREGGTSVLFTCHVGRGARPQSASCDAPARYANIPYRMKAQVTRINHYVPQWYQRGFLAPSMAKLHVLDLAPGRRILPNGRIVSEPSVRTAAPKGLFCEMDLYTTHFGETLNDDIERFLFGEIDRVGATAVRAFSSGDPSAMHDTFQGFFEYLDAQKLRTPKGLDWISAQHRGMTQLDLMIEMQGLRQMHCTMWTEGVREIVSATKSPVKFLISDHPVTVYHRECPPDVAQCAYPQDPGIDLIGSQTIFALDENHCLILSNLEYAKNPAGADVLASRTHARYRGGGLVRTDAFIRTRELDANEITAINHVLKSRARRFVAAGRADDLYPERSGSVDWRAIGEVLIPRDELWKFGGEIYVGYKDGSTKYQDEFGRTSAAHRFLRKEAPAKQLEPNDYCGCGSGRAYQNCCRDLPVQERPSWTTYSIRERNLMLCRGIHRILGLNKDKSWAAVRRELSDGQVKELNELFAALWPLDSQLSELLPRPRADRLRAVLMGWLDPRTLPLNTIGLLPYFDELILAHPFINANSIRPEYSPITAPGTFKEQTLRNAFVMLLLEPHIAAGRVHLVPDPADFDGAYRTEAWSMAEKRKGHIEFSAEDREIIEKLAHDDYMRWIKMLPEDSLRAHVKRHVPDIQPKMLDAIVTTYKRELEEDPLALLQPLSAGEGGSQFRTVKGFSLETSLFLASMTGSAVYTDLHAMWAQLHAPEGSRVVEQMPEWQSLVAQVAELSFPLAVNEEIAGQEQPRGRALQALLQSIVRSVRRESPLNPVGPTAEMKDAVHSVRTHGATEASGGPMAKLRLSMPASGFRRKEVTRLLLTFGRAKQVQPVPVAIFVNWRAEPEQQPR